MKKRTKFKIILFVILACFSLFFLFWSGLWIVTFALFIITDSVSTQFFSRFFKKKISNSFYFIIKYSYLPLAIIFTAIFCRVFLFEVFFIPSSSMEEKLSTGDFIIISKLSYGPKLPKNLSEIPFGNLLFNYQKKDIKTKNKRLNGFNDYKRNDIITFNLIENDSKTFIKRIIGLPGENLKIKNSIVLINSKPIPELSSYLFEYSKKKDKLGLNTFLMSIKDYKKYPKKDEIERKVHFPEKEIDEIFPVEMMFYWNRDNFGTIYIPQKNKSISLDKKSFKFYKKIIEYETGGELRFNKSENDIFLFNKRIESYTFKEDYFFVMGDNRHFSGDSRAFGFIPESKIIGEYKFKF